MPTSPVETALLFSAGLLAFVFALSGISKVGHGPRTLAAMAALRVPAALRRPLLAGAVPWLEVLLAAALVLAPAPALAVVGVLAALVLAAFTALLIRVLVRGDDVSCGCFGGLSADDAVTGWSVARNALLFALSVVVSVAGSTHGPVAAALVALPTAPLLLLIVLWLAVAVAVLLRSVLVLRRIPAREAGLTSPAPAAGPSAGLGEPIPEVEVVTIDGRTRLLRTVSTMAPTVLLFLSAECTSCAETARRIPHWQRTLDPIQLRVITSSDPSTLRERLPETEGIAYFGGAAARRALAVPGSPSAVLIGAHTHPVVGSPVVRGTADIDALVQSVVASRV